MALFYLRSPHMVGLIRVCCEQEALILKRSVLSVILVMRNKADISNVRIYG